MSLSTFSFFIHFNPKGVKQGNDYGGEYVDKIQTRID